MRRITVALAVLSAASACGPRVKPLPPLASHPATLPPPAGDPKGPHEAAIAALATPFVDAELLRGVVIGLVDHDRVEIYGYGSGPGGVPPDGGTLFELGSVTKVYTALLLCDAVQRRDLQLDAPLSDLLPAGVAVPTKDGNVITLHELAQRASGLPGLPPAASRGSSDPYADYSEDKLLADLPATQLATAPGTRIDARYSASARSATRSGAGSAAATRSHWPSTCSARSTSSRPT